MSGGVAASDVIRSMMRAGFSRDEIYDVLVSVGLQGEQVQLLIDRVATGFQEVELESRPSRLAVEVEKIFRRTIDDMQHSVLTRMDLLARQLELIKTEIEKLENRLTEMWSSFARFKIHKKKIRKLLQEKIES